MRLSRSGVFETLAIIEAQRRRSLLFRHLGWKPEYAPDRDCSHSKALEVENDEPIVHPDPLPDFWFPIILRHWTCAGCGTAVNPSAFRDADRIGLPENAQREWWDRWRRYERSINAGAA